MVSALGDGVSAGTVVEAAAKHKGISFVEVYQNCNIFNDGAFESFTERSVRPDHVLYLEHGKPMIFGKDRNKGIRMNDAHPEVVTIGERGITESDLLVHGNMLPILPWPLCSRAEQLDFPQPVGIFRAVNARLMNHYDGQMVQPYAKTDQETWRI